MIAPARRNTILYTIALFVAGAICGAMLMARFSPAPQSEPLKLGRTDEIAAKIRAKFADRLQLSPAQLDKMDPLIKTASAKLEAIHRECLTMIASALGDLHTRMGPDLDPDQKQLLQVLDTERAKTMWDKYRFRQDATNATTNTVVP